MSLTSWWSVWSGSRNVVSNGIVQRLELGGYRIENCPAGVINLGRWSLEANPQSERVAGIIFEYDHAALRIAALPGELGEGRHVGLGQTGKEGNLSQDF